MDLWTLLQMDAALKEAQFQRIQRIIVLQNLPKAAKEVCFCVAEMDDLHSDLPEDFCSLRLFNALMQKERVIIGEVAVIARNNFLEFHNWNGSCKSCKNTHTQCTCTTIEYIKNEHLSAMFCSSFKKLYMQNKISVVTIDAEGYMNISCARDKESSPYFPQYGVGLGFEIWYAENYHIPDQKK